MVAIHALAQTNASENRAPPQFVAVGSAGDTMLRPKHQSEVRREPPFNTRSHETARFTRQPDTSDELETRSVTETITQTRARREYGRPAEVLCATGAIRGD